MTTVVGLVCYFITNNLVLAMRFVIQVLILPFGVTLKSESEDRLHISPISLGIIVVAVDMVVADDKLSDCDCMLAGVATTPERVGLGVSLLRLATTLEGIVVVLVVEAFVFMVLSLAAETSSSAFIMAEPGDTCWPLVWGLLLFE